MFLLSITGYNNHFARSTDWDKGLSNPLMVGIWDRTLFRRTKKYRRPLKTAPIAIIPNAKSAISPEKYWVFFHHLKT